MAINLSTNLKNDILTGFQSPGSGVTLKIEACKADKAAVSDKVSMGFASPSNGETNISSTIDLAVGKVKVEWLKVYVSTGGNDTLAMTIELEGNEILDFTDTSDGGIYRIQTLTISI